MQGYHVVRGSDRFWAGLSTDQIIEQVLMRSIKTHVGLTREIHGRIPCGVTQRQVLGRIVPRPNHRASVYEKYKDTCRTDKMKGDDRKAAFGVDVAYVCMSTHQ